MVKKGTYGVYFIFQEHGQGPSFRVTVPKFPTKIQSSELGPSRRAASRKLLLHPRRSARPTIMVWRPSSLPDDVLHQRPNYIEQELNRAQIGFRKNDNAFLAVDDVAALQAPQTN